MLLYGKKSFFAAPCEVARRFATLVGRVPWPGVEEARAWLVFAGQIEQAVRDAGGPREVEGITDAAAALFVDAMKKDDTHPARQRLLEKIAVITARLPRRAAEFRVPEGFAWYALYPDAYVKTAQRWAQRNPGRSARVIGLRSIGTALSAVVAETLRRAGTPDCGRMTVRPSGHPFAREAALPGEAVRGGGSFIIVDEGPGLSGSSMAGVAEALRAKGVSARDIVFFPGHDKGPGPEARPETRRWWQTERCWVTANEAIPLEFPPSAFRLFGGFAAVDGTLETLAERKRRRQMRLADEGLALPSPAMAHGWITLAHEGEPLSHAELDDTFMTRTLARYLATAAQPGDGDAAGGIKRIAEALEACTGHDMESLSRRALRETDATRLAGDGRLSPAEWLRLGDGRIVKRNATGADCEHDWAGPQALAWDIAGAAAEWEMDDDALRLFLATLESDYAIGVTPFALAWHQAGYAALELARARHSGDAQRSDHFGKVLAASLARLEALR